MQEEFNNKEQENSSKSSNQTQNQDQTSPENLDTNNSNNSSTFESVFKEKINQLEKKNSELNEQLLRTIAELENVRRRSREELEKASKFAITNFVSELVVIVENFLMASQNAPQQQIDQYPEIKNYATAILLTEKELLKILEKNQVARIFPLNQKFDHNFHEAISFVESDQEEGSILQVIQAGYTIANRLIKPALVVVAKAKSSA
jgi:molecular chaperone GrpE